MKIIDSSYFYGDLGISQKSQAAVVANINWFIEKYEPDYCREMLGQELYKQYKDGTELPDGSAFLDESAVAQKWKDLRDGKQYENRSGVIVYFKGLAPKTNSTTKQSPIANFVFYHILRKNATSTTGSGEAKLQIENATKESSIDKQCFAWNQMVGLNYDLNEFLLSNSEVYPEYFNYVWRIKHDLFDTINPVL